MAASKLDLQAAGIWKQIDENDRYGDKLGNIFICLSRDFVKKGLGTADEFEPAFDHAVANGWLRSETFQKGM